MIKKPIIHIPIPINIGRTFIKIPDIAQYKKFTQSKHTPDYKESVMHHVRYLVICFLVITITCSSLHASYFTHFLYWAACGSPRTPCCFPPLCPCVLVFFPFPLPYISISFLLYLTTPVLRLCWNVISSWKSFLILSISSPTPTANLDPGLSLPLSMSSERPKCIFAKLYCNDLCLTDTAILNSMNLEGEKHFMLVYAITT